VHQTLEHGPADPGLESIMAQIGTNCVASDQSKEDAKNARLQQMKRHFCNSLQFTKPGVYSALHSNDSKLLDQVAPNSRRLHCLQRLSDRSAMFSLSWLCTRAAEHDSTVALAHGDDNSERHQDSRSDA
jgi:hypothetical protein